MTDSVYDVCVKKEKKKAHTEFLPHACYRSPQHPCEVGTCWGRRLGPHWPNITWLPGVSARMQRACCTGSSGTEAAVEDGCPTDPGSGLLTSFAEVTPTCLIADSSSLSCTEKCSQMQPKCFSLREADHDPLWYMDGEASCRPLLSH